MNVDRTKVTIVSPGRHGDEEAVRLGKSELLSFVWELTEEIYSLTGRDDVQSRLQVTIQAPHRFVGVALLCDPFLLRAA